MTWLFSPPCDVMWCFFAQSHILVFGLSSVQPLSVVFRSDQHDVCRHCRHAGPSPGRGCRFDQGLPWCRHTHHRDYRRQQGVCLAVNGCFCCRGNGRRFGIRFGLPLLAVTCRPRMGCEDGWGWKWTVSSMMIGWWLILLSWLPVGVVGSDENVIYVRGADIDVHTASLQAAGRKVDIETCGLLVFFGGAITAFPPESVSCSCFWGIVCLLDAVDQIAPELRWIRPVWFRWYCWIINVDLEVRFHILRAFNGEIEFKLFLASNYGFPCTCCYPSLTLNRLCGQM